MTIEKIKNTFICIIQKMFPAEDNRDIENPLETESTATGRSYFPEYNKIIAHALYDENKAVLAATDFICKLSQKQFLNDAGNIFSKEEMVDNITAILEYTKQLKGSYPNHISDPFIDITERLLSFQDEKIFRLYTTLYATNLCANMDDSFYQAVSEIDDAELTEAQTISDREKLDSFS